MESVEAEKGLYDHTTGLLLAHEALLRDARRNRAFHAALKKRVTPESVVLDIGTGTGVWAITAALLGARRVVAVERDPLLVGLVRTLARENGVQDRVEALAGDSRSLSLPREFDLVLSETIGNVAFEEDIVSTMNDARERFAKPGARFIPEAVALVGAPAALLGRGRPGEGTCVRLDSFAALLPCAPIPHEARVRLDLLAAPCELSRADLTREAPSCAPGPLDGRWQVPDAGRVSCFALWAVASLTPGVRLDTRRTSSWTPLLLRVSPFEPGPGELSLSVSMTAPATRWTATLDSERGREQRSSSPAHAAAALLAWSRGFDVPASTFLQPG